MNVEIFVFRFWGERELGFGQRCCLETGQRASGCAVVTFGERLGVEALADRVCLCFESRDEMLQLLLVCLAWHTDKAWGECSFASLSWCVLTRFV